VFHEIGAPIMKYRVSIWLLIPAIAGALAFVYSRLWVPQGQRLFETGAPSIKYPVELDLGDHESGENVTVPFAIENRGGDDLVVEDVRTSCSCTAMERQQGGDYVPVTFLRLKPGERADLVLRVAVPTSMAGKSVINYVRFRTNDPEHPDGEIQAILRHVWHGVIVCPNPVIFHSIPVGSKRSISIDVRDFALHPRVIQRIVSSEPEIVSAELLSVPPTEARTDGHPDGSLIGRIGVTIASRSARSVNAHIRVYLKGSAREPDIIPVIARIEAPIEISPAYLCFPRASAAGPVYSAQCVCRSTAGKVFSLRTDQLPPEFSIVVSHPGEATHQIVRVSYDYKAGKTTTHTKRRVLRLLARSGTEEIPLDLTVMISDPKEDVK
jgi:hypothetical protein